MNFIHAVSAVEEIFEEALLEQRNPLHHLLGHILLPLPFLSRPDHGLHQLGLLQRLQHKIIHLELQRLPGIFKFVVAGHHNDFDVGKLRLQPLCQLHPVHKRHADVRQHHLRPQLPDRLQPVLTIRAGSDHLEAVALPGGTLGEPPQNDLIVIEYRQLPKHCPHLPDPSPSARR
ncbi:hypothetical protein D3C75_578790 [compost metagenome]